MKYAKETPLVPMGSPPPGFVSVRDGILRAENIIAVANGRAFTAETANGWPFEGTASNFIKDILWALNREREYLAIEIATRIIERQKEQQKEGQE